MPIEQTTARDSWGAPCISVNITDKDGKHMRYLTEAELEERIKTIDDLIQFAYRAVAYGRWSSRANDEILPAWVYEMQSALDKLEQIDKVSL